MSAQEKVAQLAPFLLAPYLAVSRLKGRWLLSKPGRLPGFAEAPSPNLSVQLGPEKTTRRYD